MNSQTAVALVGFEKHFLSNLDAEKLYFQNIQELININVWSDLHIDLPRVILYNVPRDIEGLRILNDFLKSQDHSHEVILLDKYGHSSREKVGREIGAIDYLDARHHESDIQLRVETLLLSLYRQSTELAEVHRYKIPIPKRIFDIAVASMLILILSPLFLLVGLFIRLESRGKVFYYQPRVGTGYRIFNFYKFRSMRVGADKQVAQMQDKNQYAPASTTKKKLKKGRKLISDNGWIDEETHLQVLTANETNAFFKVKNDPRITRVGKFIRNTSIDELPQLFNVLLGDMSIVGNRPLPLYEAEKLTSDKWAKRFMAPAGITGLWQVTERGKANASSDSRKKLDVIYAESNSFWGDLIILLKTPLAALQQENV